MSKTAILDEAQCTVCKSDFLKTALDGQGRCSVCAEMNMKPKDRKDVIYDEQTKRDEMMKILKPALDTFVRDIVREMTCNKKVCSECGEEFVPNSPAQKKCDACRNK